MWKDTVPAPIGLYFEMALTRKIIFGGKTYTQQLYGLLVGYAGYDTNASRSTVVEAGLRHRTEKRTASCQHFSLAWYSPPQLEDDGQVYRPRSQEAGR